jgi:hypothetical protein
MPKNARRFRQSLFSRLDDQPDEPDADGLGERQGHEKLPVGDHAGLPGGEIGDDGRGENDDRGQGQHLEIHRGTLGGGKRFCLSGRRLSAAGPRRGGTDTRP